MELPTSRIQSIQQVIGTVYHGSVTPDATPPAHPFTSSQQCLTMSCTAPQPPLLKLTWQITKKLLTVIYWYVPSKLISTSQNSTGISNKVAAVQLKTASISKTCKQWVKTPLSSSSYWVGSSVCVASKQHQLRLNAVSFNTVTCRLFIILYEIRSAGQCWYKVPTPDYSPRSSFFIVAI